MGRGIPAPPASPLGSKLLPISSLVAVLLVGCAADAPAPSDEAVAYRFSGPTMGTFYSVQVVAPDLDETGRVDLAVALEATLEAVDAAMSTYRADSELSRFNASVETSPQALSAPTLDVLSTALEVSEATGGAFDVTVGPLVNAWGFGAESGPSELDEATIAALLARVGADHLELDLAAGTLAKARPDLYVDLSGIAKGYAVDRLAETVDEAGIGDYLVEIGGEVRARGLNPQGEVWRLGIERPHRGERGVQRIVPLDGRSLATSGDYRNYRERDGERISHLIDPRDGRPVRHRVASVSVVAERCTMADALATALIVLGAEDGFHLAAERGWAVLFLIREGEGYVERATPAFSELKGASS